MSRKISRAVINESYADVVRFGVAASGAMSFVSGDFRPLSDIPSSKDGSFNIDLGCAGNTELAIVCEVAAPVSMLGVVGFASTEISASASDFPGDGTLAVDTVTAVVSTAELGISLFGSSLGRSVALVWRTMDWCFCSSSSFSAGFFCRPGQYIQYTSRTA